MKLNNMPLGGSVEYGVENGGVNGLVFISEDNLGKRAGPIISDSYNHIPARYINLSGTSYRPMLKGETSVMVNEPYEWHITNFNLATDYNPASQYGMISQDHDIIRFTSNVVGTVSFVLAGREFSFESLKRFIETPNILNGSDPLTIPRVILESSAFKARNTEDEHLHTDWQLSLDEDFSSVLQDLPGTTTSLYTWSLNQLLPKTTYYVRLRYKGVNLEEPSEWSNPFVLQTAITAAVTPPSLVAPVPGSSGNALRPLLKSSDFHVTDWVDTHATTDWQIATEPDFENVVFFAYNDRNLKTEWEPGRLSVNTPYYVRIRHKGNNLGWSEWSPVAYFKTINLVAERPRLIYPTLGATEIPYDLVLRSTNFSSTGVLNHLTSDWEVATDENFRDVIRSVYQSDIHLTTFPVEALPYNTTLFFRVRHNSDDGIISQWSEIVSAVTQVERVDIPVILSPVDNATGLERSFFVTTSTFSTNARSQHLNTDWQIASDRNFVNIIHEKLSDSEATEWLTPKLNANTTYFIRARHRSDSQVVSPWSLTKEIKVKLMAVNQPAVLAPQANANWDFWLRAVSSNFSEVGQVEHKSSSWQLATNNTFTAGLVENMFSETDLTSWNVKLTPSTTYFLRVRHEGVDGFNSIYSPVVRFTTKALVVYQPQINVPENEAFEQAFKPSLISSAFGSNDDVAHNSSDWQLSSKSDFTTILYQTASDVNNKTTLTVPVNLPHSTTVFVRVRYRSGTTVSSWSPTSTFTTIVWFVDVPYVESIEKQSLDLSADLLPLLTASRFSSQGNLTHARTIWQLSDKEDFSSLVQQHETGTDLLQWSPDKLERNVLYYFRLKFISAQGVESGWSSPRLYKTNPNAVKRPEAIIDELTMFTQPLRANLKASVFESNYESTHVSTDWQVSETYDFATIVFENLNSNNLISLTSDVLLSSKNYYLRVRQTDSFGLKSEWSIPEGFRTKFFGVNQPTIVSPQSGTVMTTFDQTLTTTGFSSIEGTLYIATEWQLAKAIAPEVIIASNEHQSSDLNWVLNGLDANTTFNIRVRMKGKPEGSQELIVSEWSSLCQITTPPLRVEQPQVVFPQTNSEGLSMTPTFQSSVFESNRNLVHGQTEWQLALDVNFSNMKYAFTVTDASKLQEWGFPFGTVQGLDSNTVYYLRVRYRSANNVYSVWSNPVKFKTVSSVLQKPVLTSQVNWIPADNAVEVKFTSSAMSVTSGASTTHQSSDWEVATDINFTNKVQVSPADAVNKTTFTTRHED